MKTIKCISVSSLQIMPDFNTGDVPIRVIFDEFEIARVYING